MQHVEAVRDFNRFYTRRIDVLRQDFLGSPFALPEARLIYEIARCPGITATVLGRELGIDLGYLSRLLQGLKRRGIVEAKRAPEDGRRAALSLTGKGRRTFALLNTRSKEKMAEMLEPLGQSERASLVRAMGTVRKLLDGEKKAAEIRLRAHEPGDMGWVVESHGRIYAEEYGWNPRFEALVAGVVKDFLENFDVERERCRIAERGGERVGCAFLVKKSGTTAQLRLVIVEPSARGTGLGRRLVEECIAFARAKRYRKLVLWTHANLAAARHIYETLGFRRVKQEPHRTFGPRVIGEYWELKL
jgi:DNA-binding MarR family transcriptional regulator/GNAT superfamily N-acetyltransferase